MDPYASAGTGGPPDYDTGLEESMWRLRLGGENEGRLPERPGEADCVYYLRTGTCGYGERCRYNHPSDRSGTFSGSGTTAPIMEYPERLGQPVCEYYMKTGTCKFGSNCKYHHPRQGGGFVRAAQLTNSGFPLRPGEKECSYYIKTGQCKFGSTCKFHHPELGALSITPGFYPPVQQLSAPTTHPFLPLASWQMGRPPILPGPYLPGSYGPMVLSSGVIPVQGWSPYATPINQVAAAGGQRAVQAGQMYGLSHQGSSSAINYSPYATLSSSAGPSSSNQREHLFPERPGQPNCQYYMRTGDCRFGDTCKYHHPRDWSAPKSNCMLSPLGLPLRPGSQPCIYYTQHGFCKFGPTCKFDHPMVSLSYSPSASSLTDMPVAPYTLGFSIATLAPYSSSSDPWPQYTSTGESVNQLASSSESTSGPVASIFSKGVFTTPTHIPPQTFNTGDSSTSHGGKV